MATNYGRKITDIPAIVSMDITKVGPLVNTEKMMSRLNEAMYNTANTNPGAIYNRAYERLKNHEINEKQFKKESKTYNPQEGDVFTIIGTEPENRFRTYTGQFLNGGLFISDVISGKQRYFPAVYNKKSGGKSTWYNNKETAEKIAKRYKNKRWGRVRVAMFDDLYNEDGLTLGELTVQDVLTK